MTHDPLCLEHIPGECHCDLIARVREDERKRAHKIIDNFDMYSGDRDDMHAWIDGMPPDWWSEGER